MKHPSINRIAIGFATLIAFATPAMAATETVLYSFPKSGTGYPSGDLYFRNGSLYGTGAGNPRYGNGQVFKLTNKDGSWKASTLLTFDGSNGSTPFAGLVRDSNGVLYGTSWSGGAYNGGSVFALARSGRKWVEQTIWNFGGAGDGLQPECDIVMDKSGNLYGTTFSGGAYNLGTVFELSRVNGVWTEYVVYSFVGSGDGWYPYAGLLIDDSVALYGTTEYGGRHGGDGTVFELSKSGGVWRKKQIYSFKGGSDGDEPLGTLIEDKNGALYGTTYAGGQWDVGTVFMLKRSGSKWIETVLHAFQFANGSNDGFNPFAGLTWNTSGGLYGTTSDGGTPGYPGVGTVFELTKSGGAWTEAILHSFEGNSDGSYPQGKIALDENSTLYGTTEVGGTYNLGIVWKITP